MRLKSRVSPANGCQGAFSRLVCSLLLADLLLHVGDGLLLLIHVRPCFCEQVLAVLHLVHQCVLHCLALRQLCLHPGHFTLHLRCLLPELFLPRKAYL